MTAKPTTTETANLTDAKPELKQIPLNLLEPSPFNPRTQFDATKLAELGLSIREHGMLEPILVRPLPVVGKRFQSYQIVAGERRYRAALQAFSPRETVPCLVREMDDTQARLVAVTENLQRSDLDALDTARGYHLLKESGLTQQEIAEKLGISAGEVSKSLAMLELPEAVQEMVRAGTVSVGQARAIQRKLGAFPLVLSVVAETATSQQISVRSLEAANWEGYEGKYQAIARALDDAKVVRELGHKTAFQKSDCESCPHGALVKIGWSTYCLLPEEYDKKQQEALAEAEEKALALATQMQADKQRLDTKKKVTKADENIPASGEPATEAKPKLIQLADLPYGSYVQLSSSDRPSRCTDSCECIGVAQDRAGRACKICTKPGRYQSMRAQDTKERNKVQKVSATQDKAAILAHSDRIADVEWKEARYRHDNYLTLSHRRNAVAMAMAAHQLLYSVSIAARRAVAGQILNDHQDDVDDVFPFVDFLNTVGGSVDKQLGALAWWIEDESLEWRSELLWMSCAKVLALARVESNLSYGTYSTPLAVKQLLDIELLPGYEAAKKAKREKPKL